MGQFQSVEEILLYVPDTGFDAAFFVWPSHVTSAWLEAVVCCKVEVPRMKERLFAAGMLQHGGLGIVDEHFKWNTAEEFEGVLMSAQEVFGSLTEAKLEITQAAVAKHHDKERESPPGRADGHRTGAAPIDLRAFARSKCQGEERRRTHPAYRAHIVCEDGEPAGVTFLGTESLEDLGGSVRMSFQPALNNFFVGVELTFARKRLATLDVILCTS